ncbi:MBL fold metallo-hydrolase [Mycobacterium sp. smrl_JER01]|uniref:MBL fold metallo-hydrolase n=1 Tax=Mycobacterium sp. smrl_JER01 TaxID=3402633 RepID=UPI003ACE071E
MRLTLIGGPTVLIEIAGWRILTDPTFDDAGRTYRFGWGTSSRKVTGPALGADDIGPVDLILLSHDHHADNLDDSGRSVLNRAATVVTTTPAAQRLSSPNAVGLKNWETTVVTGDARPPLRVTATPCRHGPRFSGPVTGTVNGFAVRVGAQQRVALWMTGDTVLYDGVRSVAAQMDIEVVLVHCGAVRFGRTGPIRYSMSGRDAAELIATVGPRVAVPVHYEGWSHFSEREDALRRSLQPVSDLIHWLPRGLPRQI